MIKEVAKTFLKYCRSKLNFQEKKINVRKVMKTMFNVPLHCNSITSECSINKFVAGNLFFSLQSFLKEKLK